jgi:CDP-diacylglycerol---glycerol-3-phosphate 3-phosphatidyltransferase
MKIANILTFSRIFCAPVFSVLYFLPLWFPQFPVFTRLSVYIMIPLLLLAEFTDYLDGKFARDNNEVSNFGKIFDPFADVFLNLTVFFCLAFSGYLPPVVFLLILYREISIIFIRLVAMQKGMAIGARKGGKIKTVLYIISSFFALFIESALRLKLFNNDYFIFKNSKAIYLALFIICLLVSYVSFADYLFNFKNVLVSKDKTQQS